MSVWNAFCADRRGYVPMAAAISLTDGVVLDVRDVIAYVLLKVDRDKWRWVVADRLVAQRYGMAV